MYSDKLCVIVYRGSYPQRREDVHRRQDKNHGRYFLWHSDKTSS